MTFAKQLTAARKSAGLTIRDAAIRAGYSNSFIRKCEAGKHTPPARAILPILSAIRNLSPLRPDEPTASPLIEQESR